MYAPRQRSKGPSAQMLFVSRCQLRLCLSFRVLSYVQSVGRWTLREREQSLACARTCTGAAQWEKRSASGLYPELRNCNGLLKQMLAYEL